MSDPIVHVVDDDAAMRESIAFLLSTADRECSTYESAKALLDQIGEIKSGCIVTDIRMPEMNGLELVGELKGRGVLLPVIVLTGHGDVALAVQAMKAGVVDFLEKPFDDEALLKAVEGALAANRSGSARDNARHEAAARVEQLSVREREVFEGVVAGDANKVIAAKLGISPRTVEIYRANVMTKMQASSLSDLVRMALHLEKS